MPDTILDTGDMAVKKLDKILLLGERDRQMGGWRQVEEKVTAK
jgi:hypothetical protein